MDQRFRERERLRSRRDFERVVSSPCKAADYALIVYSAPNGLAWSRLGISVSKRIGNAARRHYVKRRIREAFRKNKAVLPRGLDIVCVAKLSAADVGRDVALSLRKLIVKAAGQNPSKESSRKLPRG